MTVCSVRGCGERTHIRGWCRKHYERWQRHGDPEAGRTANGRPLAWLRDAVNSAGAECVEWPFNRDRDGYGRVRYGGAFMRVGHVSLLLAGRDKPSDAHQVLHAPEICHNPSCINPNHLRLGLPYENTADRMKDGTAAVGQRNPSAKLTARQVREIRQDERRHSNIAASYGVSRSQISKIKRGAAWK